MTNINKRILNMIRTGFSNDDICKELKISKKQLKYRLRCIKRGLDFYKPFYDDEKYNYVLDLNNPGKYFRALAIADNHIGHAKENSKYLDMMYDYCVLNNIHFVLHCGDLLHGSKQCKRTLDEQINFLLNEYPSCKKITTFYAFGNHEEDFLNGLGVDLKQIIENDRDDIIPLGYGEKSIRIENISDELVICHDGSFTKPYGIHLAGHSHRYKFVADEYVPLINVPTLSDFLHTNDFPGAVEIYIESLGLDMRHLVLEHLIINESNKIKQVSKMEQNSYKKYNRK